MVVGSIDVTFTEELWDTSVGGVVAGSCPGLFSWRHPGEMTDITRRIARIAKRIDELFILILPVIFYAYLNIC